MQGQNSQQIEILYAQRRDMMQRAERGMWSCSHFLSPREARLAQSFAERTGGEVVCVFEGGYADAERVKLFVLPEYLNEPAYISPILEEKMCLLRLRGGGFCTLTHRDYLGALLALGIERHVLGDLIVTDERGAFLICDADIAAFIICLIIGKIFR